MNKLIINADDFGLNERVNEAIMAAMEARLCLDTTLLVNFEESENAAKLAINNQMVRNIGLHLNLTQGLPLTQKIKQESRFCDVNGYLNNKKEERIYRLSRSEKSAVYEEIISQIRLCRKFGIPISHADSHNHIHEEPGIFSVVIQALKQEKVPFLRLTNNMGQTAYAKLMYRKFCNYILKTKSLAATDYFASTSDLVNYKEPIKDNSIVEIMIHPGEMKDQNIWDVYAHENLSRVLPNIIKQYNLTSYSEINRN